LGFPITRDYGDVGDRRALRATLPLPLNQDSKALNAQHPKGIPESEGQHHKAA